MEHHSNVVEPLTPLVQPLSIDAGALERLQQLEAHIANVRLRAQHRVLGWGTAQLRVVETGRLVSVDVPGAPTEELGVLGHRPFEIVRDDGNLRDGERAAQQSRRHCFHALVQLRFRRGFEMPLIVNLEVLDVVVPAPTPRIPAGSSAAACTSRRPRGSSPSSSPIHVIS